MGDNGPTQYDIECRWITVEGFPGVSHRYGDIVRLVRGEHAGETAVVIALFSIEPPRYGVTLMTADEKFFWLSEDDLEKTGANSGRTLTLMKPGEPPRTSQPQ
jgi:hypothetical protein